MSVEKLDSRPELRAITYDQAWFSAMLVELEGINWAVRELLKVTKAEAKP